MFSSGINKWILFQKCNIDNECCPYSMQQHQKSINFKGHLSAQYSMPLATAFLELTDRLYEMLPCFTETKRLAGMHLKWMPLDPGSCRTVLAQSPVPATKPTLSRVAASCWAICWRSNPSSSNQTHSFVLLWGQGYLHKLQSQEQCIYAFRGWHCPKSVGVIPPFHTPLWGAISEYEGYYNKSSLLRYSCLFKNDFDSTFSLMILTQSSGSIKCFC